MRVLSLLWGFSLGGVGKVALTYGRLHEVGDVTVHTVCIQSEDVAVDLQPLQHIRSHVIKIRSRFDLSWIKKVKQEIDAFEPDLLFVHGFNGPVIGWFLKTFFYRQLPMACSYHGRYHAPVPQRKLIAPLFNTVPVWIYKTTAALIITVDGGSRNELAAQGIGERKIEVVPNGIPELENPAAMTRVSNGIAEEEIVLSVASRLDPIKGIQYLLAALEILKKEGREKIRLLIFGDGVLRNELEIQARALYLDDQVKFMGYTTNVADWLGIVDIFVLPSLSECHPIGLLEAMRAQKAIVASRVGGIPDTIESEKEGLLVPPMDPEALAAAIGRLIDNQQLRKEVALAARKRFELDFTEKRMMLNLSRCLQSISER